MIVTSLLGTKNYGAFPSFLKLYEVLQILFLKATWNQLDYTIKNKLQTLQYQYPFHWEWSLIIDRNTTIYNEESLQRIYYR